MLSRTALITAGSIAVVLVTGSFAMGANLGLIGSSDDGGAPVGQFDLADIEVAASPSTTEVQLTAQDYQVENAGSVSLRWTPGELVLAEATPAEGWTTLVDDSGLPNTVSIGFASADTVYLFTALRQPDGSVQVDVADVTPAPAPTPSGTAGSTGGGGGGFDDDGGSDDGGFDDDDGADDGGFDDDDGADDGSFDGDGSDEGGGSDDSGGVDDDRDSGGGSTQGSEPEVRDDGGDDHDSGGDGGEDEDHEYEGGEDDD